MGSKKARLKGRWQGGESNPGLDSRNLAPYHHATPSIVLVLLLANIFINFLNLYFESKTKTHRSSIGASNPDLGKETQPPYHWAAPSFVSFLGDDIHYILVTRFYNAEQICSPSFSF